MGKIRFSFYSSSNLVKYHDNDPRNIEPRSAKPDWNTEKPMEISFVERPMWSPGIIVWALFAILLSSNGTSPAQGVTKQYNSASKPRALCYIFRFEYWKGGFIELHRSGSSRLLFMQIYGSKS